MRPPSGPLSRIMARNVESVQTEIAQEKAAALSRTATRLSDALDRLRDHDAGRSPGDRPALLASAAEALWYYVIEREACGMRDVQPVLDHFRVPREVYLRMGPARRP
jgi:hypothetical protein